MSTSESELPLPSIQMLDLLGGIACLYETLLATQAHDDDSRYSSQSRIPFLPPTFSTSTSPISRRDRTSHRHILDCGTRRARFGWTHDRRCIRVKDRSCRPCSGGAVVDSSVSSTPLPVGTTTKLGGSHGPQAAKPWSQLPWTTYMLLPFCLNVPRPTDAAMLKIANHNWYVSCNDGTRHEQSSRTAPPLRSGLMEVFRS
nr:hypothetical protein CFP56_57626 [Quercus suber]